MEKEIERLKAWLNKIDSAAVACMFNNTPEEDYFLFCTIRQYVEQALNGEDIPKE